MNEFFVEYTKDILQFTKVLLCKIRDSFVVQNDEGFHIFYANFSDIYTDFSFGVRILAFMHFE